MSREKMLQAEVALKDEQLADLMKEVERLRRQAEESENFAQTVVASESKISELKQIVGKLTPAAKKTVQYATELDETRRRLAIVEKEREALSKNYSMTRGQAAALKSAFIEAQSDARTLDGKRKETIKRAKVAEASAKMAARQKLIAIVASALVCVGTIGGSYAYVKTALKPPAELSEQAAEAFKRYAPEYRLGIELATQSEREKLRAESENLAAERNRIREFNDETIWDKIVSYCWLILIFVSGFVVGALTIVATFVSCIR